MKTITKKDIIQQIHKQIPISTFEARCVLEAFLDLIIKNISSGKRIEIRNFGIFAPVLRKQKIGRNPKKAQLPIIIPARYMIKFTASQKLKKLVTDQSVTK